jgi:hypothetical protein
VNTRLGWLGAGEEPSRPLEREALHRLRTTAVAATADAWIKREHR